MFDQLKQGNPKPITKSDFPHGFQKTWTKVATPIVVVNAFIKLIQHVWVQVNYSHFYPKTSNSESNPFPAMYTSVQTASTSTREVACYLREGVSQAIEISEWSFQDSDCQFHRNEID